MSQSPQADKFVLQICHSYYDPFLDCARQYAVLFKDTPYKVITVFLSGKADPNIAEKACSDEVIFLEYESKQLSGLKINIIQSIRKIINDYAFVVCIAHRAKPTYVALLATKLPVISIRHSFGDFDRVSRRLLVNLFKSRVTILAVSNAVRNEIRQHLPKWPNEKIETLYNRIDVDEVKAHLMSRTQARKKLNLPANAWIIGSVGRLHPDKDPKTLIHGFAKALPKLPDNSLLVLIGKGKLESELKNLIKDLALTEKILLLGQIDDAKHYFKAFDVFALSSDHEPFGMVLLEAMAANLPIICSDCGGGAEVVEEIGALFPFGDSDVLASRLIEVVEPSKKNTLTIPIDIKLNTQFSDISAKNTFWGLQSVIKIFTRKINFK